MVDAASEKYEYAHDEYFDLLDSLRIVRHVGTHSRPQLQYSFSF
jgi:hypothetical protein